LTCATPSEWYTPCEPRCKNIRIEECWKLEL